MPQFVVVHVADVPGVGERTAANVYRVNEVDEATACQVVTAEIAPTTPIRLFIALASAFTRHTMTPPSGSYGDTPG